MIERMDMVLILLIVVGTFLSNKGDKYVGDWKDDKKDGKGKRLFKCLGVLETAEGDKYDGDWSNDKRNGEGDLDCDY